MPNIFLDDEPLQIPRPSLAVAVRVAIAEAQRRGRIVLQAMSDGAPLATELLENPPDEPISGELRVISADPRELVSAALRHAAEAIEQQQRQQLAVAHDLQAGRVEGALNQLQGLLAGWSAVLQSIAQCHQMLQLQAAAGDKGATDTGVLVPVLEPMARELEALKGALVREDWVALSDLLAYEVPEQQTARRDALCKLAARIEDGR